MLMTFKNIGEGDRNCHGVMFKFFKSGVAREIFIDEATFK